MSHLLHSEIFKFAFHIARINNNNNVDMGSYRVMFNIIQVVVVVVVVIII